MKAISKLLLSALVAVSLVLVGPATAEAAGSSPQGKTFWEKPRDYQKRVNKTRPKAKVQQRNVCTCVCQITCKAKPKPKPQPQRKVVRQKPRPAPHRHHVHKQAPKKPVVHKKVTKAPAPVKKKVVPKKVVKKKTVVKKVVVKKEVAKPIVLTSPVTVKVVQLANPVQNQSTVVMQQQEQQQNLMPSETIIRPPSTFVPSTPRVAGVHSSAPSASVAAAPAEPELPESGGGLPAMLLAFTAATGLYYGRRLFPQA